MKEQLHPIPGSTVRFQGRPYVIARLLDDLVHVVARDADTGALGCLPLAELQLPLEEEDTVVRAPVAEQLTAAQHQVAHHRMAVLQSLAGPPGDRPAVATVAALHAVHPSTIYRWRERLESTGRVSALANRPGQGGRARVD
jgi:putative transposase